MQANEVMNFILNGGRVKRYHTVPCIKEDTVGQHSFGVAWFLYLIVPKKQLTVNLLLAAMAHDLGEQATGDIPAPTKRLLGDAYDKHEKELLDRYGLAFKATLTDEERGYLKMADYLDGMAFCLYEMNLGNRHVAYVYRNYRSYIHKLRSKDIVPELIELLIKMDGEFEKLGGFRA